MIDVKKIVFADLKKACDSINKDADALEKADLKKLKTVGIKRETLAENFCDAVDALAKAGYEDKMDQIVVDMYNTLLSDEAEPKDGEGEDNPPEEEKEEPKDEPKDEKPKRSRRTRRSKKKDDDTKEEPKDEKPKGKGKKKDNDGKGKEEKPKKEAAKSEFGHLLSKNTGQMDEMLKDGTTKQQMVDVLGVENKDISRHFRRLKKKGFTITKKGDDKDAMSVVYTVRKPKK